MSWAGDVDDAQCLRYASNDLTHASVSCSRTCRKVFEAARVMAVANVAQRVSKEWTVITRLEKHPWLQGDTQNFQRRETHRPSSRKRSSCPYRRLGTRC